MLENEFRERREDHVDEQNRLEAYLSVALVVKSIQHVIDDLSEFFVCSVFRQILSQVFQALESVLPLQTG